MCVYRRSLALGDKKVVLVGTGTCKKHIAAFDCVAARSQAGVICIAQPFLDCAVSQSVTHGSFCVDPNLFKARQYETDAIEPCSRISAMKLEWNSQEFARRNTKLCPSMGHVARP